VLYDAVVLTLWLLSPAVDGCSANRLLEVRILSAQPDIIYDGYLLSGVLALRRRPILNVILRLLAAGAAGQRIAELIGLLF
jgi:hypothetical protein